MQPSKNVVTAAAPIGSPLDTTAEFMLTVEKYLSRVVEIVAALLIAAEVIILFAGVISRYFLQRPLVWSDELASLLFLGLANLVAVVAFRRNEHMRMTAFVGMASERVRSYLEAISIG